MSLPLLLSSEQSYQTRPVERIESVSIDPDSNQVSVRVVLQGGAHLCLPVRSCQFREIAFQLIYLSKDIQQSVLAMDGFITIDKRRT